MAGLISVADLSTRVHRDAAKIPEQDAYALQIIEQASDVVRAAARRLTWGTEVDGQPVTFPTQAKWITLDLAARVYNNPRNLSARDAGPITERYFDTGLVGMELTGSEREQLQEFWPDAGGGNGLWVQPTSSGTRVLPIYVGDATHPDALPVLYADPEDAGAFG